MTRSCTRFDAARDRLLVGRRQDSHILRYEERRRVAVHEAGHALAAALSASADPIAKLTILPTRRALGMTEQLPLDERRLYAEEYLRDTLTVRLAGRVAERLALDSASSVPPTTLPVPPISPPGSDAAESAHDEPDPLNGHIPTAAGVAHERARRFTTGRHDDDR